MLKSKLTKKEKEQFIEELKLFFDLNYSPKKEDEFLNSISKSSDEKKIFLNYGIPEFELFIQDILLYINNDGSLNYKKLNASKAEKEYTLYFKRLYNFFKYKFGAVRVELIPTYRDYLNCEENEKVAVLYFLDKNLYLKFSASSYNPTGDVCLKWDTIYEVVPEIVEVIQYNKV